MTAPDRAPARDAYQRAAASFPKIALQQESFARWLVARPAEGHEEDSFLACACAAGDGAAIAAVKLRLDGLRPLLASIDPSPSFADEVLQIALVRLVVRDGSAEPGIAGYRATGSLRNWMRAWVVRLASRQREQRARDEVLPSDSNLPHALTPELDYLHARYRREVEGCIRDELEALPARERTMLRLHHVDGLPADKLGAIYHVSRPTISRWLAKIRDQLLAGVRVRLEERLGLPPQEFESLLARIVGDLHVSVSRLLDGARGEAAPTRR